MAASIEESIQEAIREAVQKELQKTRDDAERFRKGEISWDEFMQSLSDRQRYRSVYGQR